MKYLRNNSTDPYFNMAFDEFCLEQLEADEPVFYLWQNRPSVIIGLNQNPYAEVDLPYMEEKGILLVRRVTGGGAVYHDLQNLNYTITGRIRDLERDYPAYVETMARALRTLGVPAVLSGRNDILVDGRKCSGYAKRIARNRLMIHGTLMYDVDIATLTRVLSTPSSKLSTAGIASVPSRVANLKDYLPRFRDIGDFRKALQKLLAGKDGEIRLDRYQFERIRIEAQGKFKSWEWIYGRSPSAGFRASRKFSCGTVEASFTLKGGRIQDIRFSGDFLGNRSTDELERYLQGCKFIWTDLVEFLRGVRVGDYFDGMTPEDLAELLQDA